ncbi:MAG: hypothetical protein Q9169_008334 [Polycauliona sp. 2 TL-2023]
MTMVLADFNASVLKLATIPNLLLNDPLADGIEANESGGGIAGFDELARDFPDTLRKCSIEIRGISGSWGPEFSAMALLESSKPSNHVLILASETIYSCASTWAFTQTIMDLIRKSEENGAKARALVAAKMVYFGVGGSVDDFLDVLGRFGGEAKVVWTSANSGGGVSRCILDITSKLKEASVR